MSSLFFTLMILAMAAVLGALFIGVFGMAKGGEFNRKYGNKLMKARVYLQAGALLFFVLAIVALKK
ncbi:MAG TPA: twin transmembrane helix small protein [Alphaproteobacteria bacterium]|nr:twin transmembrane helix small protein [Alphaproteobacteria bacterium]